MKKWKIILSILLVIVIGAAGTAYYFLKVKDYHTTDKEVDKITESDYTIKLPSSDDGSINNGDKTSGKSETADSEKNVDTDSTDHSKTDGSENISSDNDKTDASTDNQSSDESENNDVKVSAEEIKSRYKPVFEELQSQANGKINALVGHAFSEYQAKKANGEDISYSYFYSKYTSAGESLEAKTNAAFNTIYNSLVNELKENGYNADEAKEFQDQYESAKSQRRQALIKTALSKL